MATGKKFYWLKLHKDFFKRHDVRVIESMENGKDYILFYLKLLVESVSHEGTLRFSETIPYDDRMLATITNTNIDIVRTAIKIFTELNLMEIFDDKTIYLKETAKMLGFETDYARQKRTQRQSLITKSAEIVHSKSIVSPQPVHQEKEIEIDIEKEIDKEIDINTSIRALADAKSTFIEKEKYDYEAIRKYWNSKNHLTNMRFISENRKKHIKARIEQTSIENFYQMIDMVAESDFLIGNNKNNWKANFDWCINPNNYIKILEGNYKNKESDLERRVRQLNERLGEVGYDES